MANFEPTQGNLQSDDQLHDANKTFRKPAQEKLESEIHVLKSKMNCLLLAREVDENTSLTEIKKIKSKLVKSESVLKTKICNAKNQRKYRTLLKAKIKKICSTGETSDAILHGKVGRPRLEEKQPELLKTIVDIAMFGSAAHDRRRADDIRSCRTLTDLHEKLLESGFMLSRSATYLRLLPKNFNLTEGKRHISTTPVRLCKAQTESHKNHPDGHFCTNTIRNLESLASMLGPKQVGFISQDDKARVPIGLTAAQKQSPLLMHMQVRIILPDHDWVIAERHKLIPSVYAGIVIKPNGLGAPDFVTYSGPTYITIRSGKHSSSTAATHAADLNLLMELDIFDSTLKYNDKVKPVLILTVDGGPDENPR